MGECALEKLLKLEQNLAIFLQCAGMGGDYGGDGGRVTPVILVGCTYVFVSQYFGNLLNFVKLCGRETEMTCPLLL
jgi:hypothetical protein